MYQTYNLGCSTARYNSGKSSFLGCSPTKHVVICSSPLVVTGIVGSGAPEHIIMNYESYSCTFAMELIFLVKVGFGGLRQAQGALVGAEVEVSGDQQLDFVDFQKSIES